MLADNKIIGQLEYQAYAKNARAPDSKVVPYVKECEHSLKSCCIFILISLQKLDKGSQIVEQSVDAVGAWLSGYNTVQFMCCELADLKNPRIAYTACSGAYHRPCPMEDDAVISKIDVAVFDKYANRLPYYTTTGSCVEHKGAVKEIVRAGKVGCLDVPCLFLVY